MNLYTKLSTISTGRNGFSCGNPEDIKRNNVLLKCTKIVILRKICHIGIDITECLAVRKNV